MSHISELWKIELLKNVQILQCTKNRYHKFWRNTTFILFIMYKWFQLVLDCLSFKLIVKEYQIERG